MGLFRLFLSRGQRQYVDEQGNKYDIGSNGIVDWDRHTFNYYYIKKTDGTILIQIPFINAEGQDNMQNLDRLYHLDNFADGGKTYVGVQLTTDLLEMYGADPLRIRETLGEALFNYLSATKDGNGKYIYPNNPPLAANRK